MRRVVSASTQRGSVAKPFGAGLQIRIVPEVETRFLKFGGIKTELQVLF